MNVKALATGVLLLLAVGGMVYVLVGGDGAGNKAATATSVADDDLPDDGVVVYYFHGNMRCTTCTRMESLAAEVIDDRFGAHLRDGSVIFRAVNLETDATRHFVEDFEMTNRVVVMVERQHGEDITWRRLDAIWDKISDNDEVYTDYIVENLAACLDHLGLEAG